MKTFAELNIICNQVVANTETKDTFTEDIYREKEFNTYIERIKEINHYIIALQVIDDNACFTRKELSDYLQPNDFKRFTPTFKEPFTVNVDGEKITATRYYYSKEKVLEILNHTKEDLKHKIFSINGYSLDSVIRNAEEQYEQAKYRFETLKNRRVQAIQVLSELNELDL